MKIKLLVSFSVLLLFLNSNKGVAQNYQPNGLEADEKPINTTYSSASDDVQFQVCTGALTVSYEVVNGGDAVEKSYLYIKVNGIWKNITTLRQAKNSSGAELDYNSYAHANPCCNGAAAIPQSTFNLPANKDHYNVPQKWVLGEGNNNSSPNYYSCAYQDNLNLNDYAGNLLVTPSKNIVLSTFGSDGAYPPNGDGGAPLPGAYAIQLYSSNGGGDYSIAYRILNLPHEVLSSGFLEVRLYREYRISGDASAKTWQLSPFVLNPPTGLTASTTKCGQVDLNWSLPYQTWYASNACTTPEPQYTAIIYRNGAVLDTTAGDSSNYIDYTAQPGVSYNYQVSLVHWKEGKHTYTESSKSSLATGNLLAAPAQPSSLTATTNDCTGKINLNWNQPVGTAANSYNFRTINGGSVTTTTLSGGTRAYSDNVTRGLNYTLQLIALNVCNYASDTATTFGISPADPAMATGITAVTNTTTNSVDVAWTDNANNETNYEIVRTDDEGNTILTDINANSISYNDNSVAACRLYIYKIRVFNSCVLSGVTSTTSATVTLPPPNLGGTFDATHKLIVSKGYFGNRVELSWSNNNGTNIDAFQIYRKQLGSSSDSVQITSLSGTNAFYVDNTADAGILYKYTITGQKNCSGSTLYTNSWEDVGFRSPTGNISGQVEYNGSVAVEGAKVYVQPSGSAAGSSIKLAAGGLLSMATNSTLNLTTALRLEFWYKPVATAANNSIIQKPGVFSFSHIGTKYVASAVIGGTTYTVAIADSQLPLNNWNHVSVDYTGTQLKIFVDGLTIASTTVLPANGTLASVSNAVVIGDATGSFNMDAFRLLAATALDTTIYTDYSLYLNGTETGFRIKMNFGEGVGNYAYDGSSQNSIYNANHFVMNNTALVSWSTDIPSQSELGYTGVTDSLGNYFVSGVPYTGSGESYDLTPWYYTHSFSPSNRTVFMGDGSSIYTAQNFTDNSSFNVTGSVFYAPKNISTCPTQGAFVQVDGNTAVQSGVPVQTDANGNFTVQVPIGKHYISLSESGHTYSAGRFPPTGTYNFQAPVSGIQFIDSTFVKIIGRVVGGTRESSKPMVLGRSKNNIGQAKIVFETLNSCYSTTITTTDSSGDYVAYLPPLKYQTPNFSTTNLGSPNFTTFEDAVFSNNALLDISNIPPTQKLVDTLFTNANHLAWSRIDSINYQVIRSWTYRNTPAIWVSDLKGRDYLTHSGDTSYVYTDDVTSSTYTLAINDSTFHYPVYRQRYGYDFKVGAIETYQNHPSTRVDSVPVSTGLFTINNALATNVVQNVEIDTVSTKSWNLDTVYYHYTFTGGNPTTNYTAGSTLNFAQQLSISFQSGPNNVSWLPRAGNKPFEGILLGSKSSDGQGFVTLGPQVTQYILRDPPGSLSYSSLQVGSTISTVESWNLGGSATRSLDTKITLGTDEEVGIGVETETKEEAAVNINANLTTSINADGSLQTDITTTQAWQTFGQDSYGNAGLIGADGDIYVGKAMNVTFGINDNVVIIPVSQCTLSGVSCRTETLTFGGNQYAVGLKQGLACAPGGYATSFMYTQNYIINQLMPNLVRLRNNLFISEPQKYSSNLPSSSPYYGYNNDSHVFGASRSNAGSNDTITTVPADTTGPSYKFHGGSNTYTVAVKSTLGKIETVTMNPVDSIRWYNQQIRLWVGAISLNEQDKYEAIQNSAALVQNVSLSGGVIYENTTEIDNTQVTNTSFEVASSLELKAELTAQLSGTGIDVGSGLTVNLTAGGGSSNSTTSTNVSSYHLEDDINGDAYSIDVRSSKRGYTAMFDLIAGQTMCPWEGNVYSQFYTVGGHPVLLSGGTLHRELVAMKVDGSPSFSEKLNIPANSQASYDLEIINNTETGDADSYLITILNNTNPNGAILTIDGFNPSSQLYSVPANSSIHKTLLLAKGVSALNYDSIAVVVGSSCNSNSGDPAVGDTIYVTAHFLPSCTDVNISNPLDQFVVNNSFNDTLPIVISGYDINYNGLKNISFQFKPSSQASWIPLQAWYEYVQSAGPDSLSISQSNANTFYNWSIDGIPDGNYDMQATSTCALAGNQSVVFSGVIDRINPHLFGTPSPGSGILNPGDDISIQFNETIDAGSLSDANFDIRGVLNGIAIRHAESLNFDGTSSYAEVVGGASLQERDFTFEFWAKPALVNAQQTVIYQGTDALQNIVIGFDANNKFNCKIGSGQAISASVVDSANWHHYTVAYSYTAQTANLFIDGAIVNTGNNSIVFDYIGSGKLTFGKNALSNADYFKGNMHEMRLWNEELNASSITSTMNTILNNNSIGLLYNWKMNEETGSVANDDIRSRNADLYNTTWQVNPNGNAVQFDGTTSYVKISSGTIAISQEMDFTLEFWFNSTQTNSATLFSNGKGDGLGADSLNSWNIQKNANGVIHVYHKGLDFVAISTNFFDGNWHHFALVMQRTANLSAYIDGNLQNSVQALSFVNMAGANIYLGVRGYQTGTITNYDNFYDGKMDEFRLWNTSRTVEQIVRDKQNRMQGNEYGLQAFLPFEQYATVLGVPILTSSFNDFSVNTLTVTTTSQHNPVLITQTPTLKLPRPTQAVNFSYSVNNDKIIFTTTALPALIENVTLDITVKNVQDLHGNTMQSPVTWIAYINQNQVKWQDVELDFTKTVDSTISFTANIVNSGGASEAYTISGLPSWLSSNITSGTIAPNSTQSIQFTVLPGESIGDYNADLSLTTDFGYAEILHLNLNVVGIVPTWTVNPANFQYSMNIFGQMKIDNVIATNPNNKIAAFNNGVICGVANLQYIPTYDRYEVFLNVYSNSVTGDSIKFNLYDASSGLTFVNVTPIIGFVENDVIGTVTNPVTFAANTEIALQIPLNSGWTWASFPLQTTSLHNSNSLMQSISPTSGDVVLSSSGFDQYDSNLGWLGNISQGGGYYNNQSYKINTANADTLIHIGSRINPDSAIAAINVVPGWNWIGFVSVETTPLSVALGNYNAATGDLIKSQYAFAYYDNLNGWTGSLTNMNPTLGYMLKSSGTSTFSYPLSLFAGRLAAPTPGNANVQSVFPFKPEQYSNTMSAILNGNICTDALSQGNVAIGAFDANNTLRGYAYPTMVNNKYIFYLTLYSNSNGESLNLQYFNTTNGMILPITNNLLFSADNLAGTPASPIQANVADSLSCIVVQNTTGISSANNQVINCSVYPNPFSDALTLSFNKEVSCKIELVDMLGKVIFTSAVNAKKEINLTPELSKLNVANGMYYLHLTGDINKQIKIIRTK